MTTPCQANPDFEATNKRATRRAATACFTCPVIDLCWELGKGERYGVWGGTTSNDPERKAFRAENDAAVNCRNGHPRAEHGTEVDLLVEGGQPIFGCRECLRLSRQLAAAS